jgi:pimeloyl-ACP methyl ester carboxylesterase
MPYVTTDDGVRLYYEDVGSGIPLLFVHEFAGDYRSYEPQLRHFGRLYRCITYSARGYPPSEVPDSPASYSQSRAVADMVAVLDGLGIDRAHVVGISMGGFATLEFGVTQAHRARSLTIAGCGYGAPAEKRAQFQEEAERAARNFDELGAVEAGRAYAQGPTRVQFENKDPRGYAEFASQLGEHSAKGSANTLRGVQKARRSLFDWGDEMAAIDVPTLVMTGDEDEPCLEASLFMKRRIPTAGLVVMANTGHTLNLEEPAAFNDHVQAFLHAVELGRWPRRDPRSQAGTILGTRVRRG